jgi:large subunit ribosomal protein L3
MKFILAKKLGMTQVFDEEGKVHPVTLLLAPTNVVSAIRSMEKDGYEAVQVALGSTRREFRTKTAGFKVGDQISVEIFEKGDKVDVTGLSKGKGFQGVVKRHGFGGAPKSHGTKHAHREPGSIGPTHPQHVIKGRRMAGHMGMRRVTVKNLKVIEVDREKNLLLVEGAVPGSRGTLLVVKSRK